MEMVVRIEGTMGALIAGETLCCRITFTNTTDETEKIAWAGAQLHCQCLFRREVVKMNVPEDANPSSPITDTAFFPNKGTHYSAGTACNKFMYLEVRRNVMHTDSSPRCTTLLIRTRRFSYT